jgi:hypothetical protein
MNQLPDKPSELIRLAVKDMQLCEADPRYKLDMRSWHRPVEGACHVCMAGAVMAQTLTLSPYIPINCSLNITGTIDFQMRQLGVEEPSEQLRLLNKLRAIDAFREGYLEAVTLLGIDLSAINLEEMYTALPFLPNPLEGSYDNYAAQDLPLFYEHMLAIADEFERRNF